MYTLFGFEPFRAKELCEQGYHPVVSEEESIFFEKEATGFERFEFAFELGNADDTGDKFNIVALEQLFELPLRVFCYEADGSCTGVD